MTARAARNQGWIVWVKSSMSEERAPWMGGNGICRNLECPCPLAAPGRGWAATSVSTFIDTQVGCFSGVLCFLFTFFSGGTVSLCCP